ncbi:MULTISPECIES: isopentenyl-diphosphate Delta-isomerase [unclassified Clostridium]|uniref:isopentenyl-diphosphate Delta-isomerase n=1 Tax=unclassified Clostridium TaxID=2614128 RepID=UPI001C8C670B|nr:MULTISPECIES: isopentenyl-diphosphate Delta-isomerase [unclassified Clostridium]MBX9136174.1 isopentenyl-diphosphate Delta-isomerase [Clostridium sp. K12(2020)]MBX9143194.1 isopentenyl-diphosphate Delta-isomerase [Clostridium sp. K13]
MKEIIICVDKNDNEVGHIEKMDAHIKGLLHRALSIFIFNEKNELLLQKRYSGKYHSPGLWTNTCCTHPNKDESTDDAAIRRLQEEMGFSCDLKEVFSFMYYIKFDNDLIEHEFDHVYFGRYSNEISINPLEVEDYKWISLDNIKVDLKTNPDNYTFWFKYIIENHIKEIEENLNF